MGLPKFYFVKRKDDNNKTGQSMVTISQDLLYQAHKYFLNNSYEIQPYINEYIDYIRRTNPVISSREKWAADEHNKSFINWFRNQIVVELTNSPKSVSNTLRWLAHGPHMIVSSYEGIL